MQTTHLANEWSLLQNQFDSYEKYSLLIKVFSVGLLAAALISNTNNIFIICLLIVLWAQDAIWKTFQSRIETRLLQLEGFLLNESESSDQKAYQFNSVYLQNRPSVIGLMAEYCKQGLRPTVIFPHIVLLILSGFFMMDLI